MGKENQLQVYSYGPFDIPKKDVWFIIGSGPTGHLYREHINKDIGLISLNMTICSIDRKVDINIQSHYESVLQSYRYFFRADRVYLPDPIHVGYRCILVAAMNVFSFADMHREDAEKYRFFRKDDDIETAMMGSYSLYAKHTIACSALHLLSLNNVKEVYYCGIDGGTGRDEMFKDEYSFIGKRKNINYDKAKQDFIDTAKTLRMKIIPIQKYSEVVYA